MKMDRDLVLNEKCYSKIIHNEKVYNTELGFIINSQKMIRLYAMCGVIFFNVLKNIILFKKRKKKIQGTIGLGWQPIHFIRLIPYMHDGRVLDVGNKAILTKVTDYGKIDLWGAFLFAISARPISDKFTYDSRPYRFFLHILYQWLKMIVERSEEVYISGHFDRHVSVISDLCTRLDKKLNLVQHGCIQIFDKPFERNFLSGNIYYMFEFSIPFFDSFIHVPRNVEYFPQKLENSFVPSFKFEKPTIVYGCQDAIPNFNIIAIEAIVEVIGGEHLYIIPHPRENSDFYINRYANKGVKISKEKPVNPLIFVSRFSTLGLEYANIGIESVFLNLDKVTMDFTESGNYLVFNQIQPFKAYLSEKISQF